MDTKTKSHTTEIKENKSNENAKSRGEGNLHYRITLLLLSFIFSGWGQWHSGQKIRGLIFLLAPLFTIIYTIFSLSTGFIYLSLFSGLFTGPIIFILPLSIILSLPIFITPLFWFGVPLKFVCLVDAWMLGGKKPPRKIRKSSSLIFIIFSLITILLVFYKFSFVNIKDFSPSPLAEPGDFIIVVRSNTAFGKTFTPIKKSIQRGKLIATKGEHKLMRIMGYPGEHVFITTTSNGILKINVIKKNKVKISFSITENKEPCVLLFDPDKYVYCKYYNEKTGKDKSYLISYISSKKFSNPIVNMNFLIPKNSYFMLPDNRSLKKSDLKPKPENIIIGLPFSIIWSSHSKEGIRWNRIGKSLFNKM
jgi:Signal peptidase, peptidase S26